MKVHGRALLASAVAVAVAVDVALAVDVSAMVDVGPAVGPMELDGVCRVVHGVVGAVVDVTPPEAAGA
jgi:hypothetical protein